jgi:hypothetical protein
MEKVEAIAVYGLLLIVTEFAITSISEVGVTTVANDRPR